MIKRLIDKYNCLNQEIRAAIWFIACNCIQKGLNVVVIPIFTYLMTVEQYGVYSVYHSWVNVVSVVVTLNLFSGGFNNAMIKYENQKEKYTSSIQTLMTLMGIVWLLAYMIFSKFFNSFLSLSVEMVFCMFIEIILNASFSLWAAKERFEYRYKTLIFTTVLYALLFVIIPAFAVLLADSPDMTADIRIRYSVVAIAISYGWIYIYNALKGKIFFSKTYWKFALKFNVPLLPHYLSMIILGQMDRIMISNMVGSCEAAIYSVAYTIAICLQVITTALNQAFAPWLYRKLRSKNYSGVSSIISFQLLIMLLFSTMLTLVVPEIIMILSTDKYYEAAMIIAPVAGSTFFIFVFQLLANLEFYYYKNYLITIGSVCASILNIVLNYVLIEKCGYLAAGYTTLACYVVLAIMHTMFVLRILKLKGMLIADFININQLVFLSIITVIVCCGVPFLYKQYIVRYVLFIIELVVLFLNRNRILEIILKKERK